MPVTNKKNKNKINKMEMKMEIQTIKNSLVKSLILILSKKNLNKKLNL